jgi:hypothetical protein
MGRRSTGTVRVLQGEHGRQWHAKWTRADGTRTEWLPLDPAIRLDDVARAKALAARLALRVRRASAVGGAGAAETVDYAQRREGPASVQPPLVAGIYFIQSAEPGNPIKIGVAQIIARRFAGLQTAHAWPLMLRAWMPGGRAEEEALHVRFASARLRGEWFHATEALESLIAECRGGHHAS